MALSVVVAVPAATPWSAAPAGAQEPAVTDPATGEPVVPGSAAAADPFATTVPGSEAPLTAPVQTEGGAGSGSIEATTTTGRSDSAVDRDAVDAENRRLVLIVGGLGAVALALLVLTVRYWRVTRPGPPTDALDRLDDLDGRDDRYGRPIRAPEASPRGGRSRQAIAGADHAAADSSWAPRATGEVEAVGFPDELSKQRPSRSARARLLSSGD